MLRSLYSGVSGMKGFQTKLDVIGNNVANVNTVGFKKGRVMFQDILNQNIGGATAPANQSGGVNPKQVGLGTKIGSIDTIHTPGSPMTTNVGTDLAIDGDAFFVVTNGGVDYLTRAGNFTRDANGDLVNSNGYSVSGVALQNPPAGSPAGTPGTLHSFPINISVDERSNRDAAGNVITQNGIPMEPLKFTSYSIDSNGYINVVAEDGRSGKLAKVMDPQSPYYNLLYMNTATGNQNENISLETAVVPNPGGLKKVGNTLFQETANSGLVDNGRIADNNGGEINSGVLEMSNVDLTEEFTEMIVGQRGFQANARTITTSDSILEEIVNLKR
ncbi:flagellar basal body rod protein FlgG [Bacillus sp. AFS073361]|uniref:flagellar hook-basal body complex protein n=1 Tax=Bacillus sp. AFS073361 TaxID=2033511 RepID=UPI000BF25E8C|nr:flagellar hook-basal body complex protein [Bacillus sp. AFS073361]PFP30815.1 flagellar basal body rod protein FlgG [Bacillus sp. AFS073361]